MQIFVLQVASVFLEQVEFLTHSETVILKTKLPEPWTCGITIWEQAKHCTHHCGEYLNLEGKPKI